jgi:hypothetical protein
MSELYLLLAWYVPSCIMGNGHSPSNIITMIIHHDLHPMTFFFICFEQVVAWKHWRRKRTWNLRQKRSGIDKTIRRVWTKVLPGANIILSDGSDSKTGHSVCWLSLRNRLLLLTTLYLIGRLREYTCIRWNIYHPISDS